MNSDMNDALKEAANTIKAELPTVMNELISNAELYPNYNFFAYNHEKFMVPKVSRKEFKNNCACAQAKVASCIQSSGCDEGDWGYDYILEFTVHDQLVRTYCTGDRIYQEPGTFMDILYYKKDPRKVKDVSEKRKKKNRHNKIFLICFGTLFLFVIAVTILHIVNS